jgi:hypothetical protein
MPKMRIFFLFLLACLFSFLLHSVSVPISLACNNLPTFPVYYMYVSSNLQFGRLSSAWLLTNELQSCY